MKHEKQDKYESPVKAIFTGIKDLLRKKEEELSLEGSPALDGKKILVTGSSSGLGYATAVELARRGAKVIMAVRSGIPEKGEAVKRESGSGQVFMLPVDLADPASIARLVQEVKANFDCIDILICNAAIVTQHSRVTKEGLDEMFAVNYLAKYMLITGMLNQEVFNHQAKEAPRIIVVNSESHRNPEGIVWEKFGLYESYGIKKSVSVYAYYKLLLLTLTHELSRRLNEDGRVNFSVSALCPGPVNSNIAREAPALFQPLLRLVFRIFFRSPEKACRPIIYLASSGEQSSRAMDYLFLMNRKAMDPKATDADNGRKLWELTEKLAQSLQPE